MARTRGGDPTGKSGHEQRGGSGDRRETRSPQTQQRAQRPVQTLRSSKTNRRSSYFFDAVFDLAAPFAPPLAFGSTSVRAA